MVGMRKVFPSGAACREGAAKGFKWFDWLNYLFLKKWNIKLSLARVFMLITLMMTCKLSFGGGYWGWSEVGRNIGRNIYEIFIKAGMCASTEECKRKEIYLFESTKGGLDLYIYRQGDQAVIADVLSVCARALAENKMKEVKIRVFYVNHQNAVRRGSFFDQKEDQVFTLKGRYADN